MSVTQLLFLFGWLPLPGLHSLSLEGQQGDLVAVLHKERVLYRDPLRQGVDPPPSLVLPDKRDIVAALGLAALATVGDDAGQPPAAPLLLPGRLPELGGDLTLLQVSPVGHSDQEQLTCK